MMFATAMKKLGGVGICVMLAASLGAIDKKVLQEADRVWGVAQRGDAVAAGKEAWLIAEAAQWFEDEGKLEEAIEYFGRACVVAPLWIGLRFHYAELCAEEGRAEEAKVAYRQVLKVAETDEMIEKSASFLGEVPYAKLASLKDAKPMESGGLRICVVVVPGTQQWLAHEVGARLGKLLGIEVVVEEIDFVPKKESRSGLVSVAKTLREQLPWDDWRFRFATQKEYRIDTREELNDEQVVELSRRLMERRHGKEAAMQFSAQIKRLEKEGGQWDQEVLCSALKVKLPLPEVRGRTLFMALIPQDMFAKNTNFLFGTAAGPWGLSVASYYRFASEFTGEPPRRGRLLDRTYKQMLSSVGFLLGVPRSSDPTCARAYPASLTEHDSKGDELCEECRREFEKALGHGLGK